MQYDVWFRTNIQKLLISHLQTTTRKKKNRRKAAYHNKTTQNETARNKLNEIYAMDFLNFKILLRDTKDSLNKWKNIPLF